MPSRGRLQNAPLVHVLAQARYSQVVAAPSRMQPLREVFKRIGLPRFEQSQMASVTLRAGEPPLLTPAPRWDFLNKDKTTAVVLAADFVTLQTSAYRTFDDFLDQFRTVLRAVRTAFDPVVAERLGIRYIDLVRPRANESLADYLQPEMLGFPFAAEKALKVVDPLSRVETVAQTEQGTLIARCSQVRGQFLPADLWPSNLSYRVDLPAGELISVLDCDHFTLNAIDFEEDALSERLGLLHSSLSLAFRIAVTKHAMDVWSGDIQ